MWTAWSPRTASLPVVQKAKEIFTEYHWDCTCVKFIVMLSQRVGILKCIFMQAVVFNIFLTKDSDPPYIFQETQIYKWIWTFGWKFHFIILCDSWPWSWGVRMTLGTPRWGPSCQTGSPPHPVPPVPTNYHTLYLCMYTQYHVLFCLKPQLMEYI